MLFRSGEKMEDMSVTIYSKAGEGGRLFGSITSKDIAEQLKKPLGFIVSATVIIASLSSIIEPNIDCSDSTLCGGITKRRAFR